MHEALGGELPNVGRHVVLSREDRQRIGSDADLSVLGVLRRMGEVDDRRTGGERDAVVGEIKAVVGVQP